MRKAEVANFYCILKKTVKPTTIAIFTLYSAISDVSNKLVISKQNNI